MTPTLIAPLTEAHAEFLRDESRRSGHADSISFPQTEEEVVEILREMRSRKRPVTTQGARTGITAGAVPDGGHILNLSRMKRVTGLRYDTAIGRFCLRVQPGILLSEVNGLILSLDFNVDAWDAQSCAALEALRGAGPHFFSPDPTEDSATLGGMAACNASGARSFYYGPVRRHIRALRVATAAGSIIALRRDAHRAQGRSFTLCAEDGTAFAGRVPSYRFPSVKNAAGYYAADDMDLADLFIGGEGTLGVITEIELALLPLPPVIWGLMAFFPSQESALRLVRAVRGETVDGVHAVAAEKPAAIEFFNRHVLDLLRRQRRENSAFSEIREIDSGYHSAVYVEFHGKNEETVADAVMAVSEIIRQVGGDENATWLADNRREMRNLKFFRHAVPEAVNLLIDERRRFEPELTKLGTDMAAPDHCLEAVMAMYDRDLDRSGLESVIFGHIGDNHVHVNILPRSMKEYQCGKERYAAWAREIASMGGSVAGEHGVGKLKRDLLALMYGEAGIDEMRAVKRVFDPEGLLNRGNLFAG